MTRWSDSTAASSCASVRGAPTVTVMLMEGQKEVSFVSKGRLRMQARGGLAKTLEAPAGSAWTIRLKNDAPGEVGYAVQVAELRWSDKADLEEEKRAWAERGLPLIDEISGSLYGIAGHILDNRRHNLLIGEPLTESKAKDALADLHAKFGVQGTLWESLRVRPHGVLEVVDARGAVLAVAQDLAVATSPDGAPFLIKGVRARARIRLARATRPHLPRRARARGRPGRRSHGGQRGAPGELFARHRGLGDLREGHPEALKAQAVTARGEVLAKIGTRHLTDPYLLCAEQHCQVYAGIGRDRRNRRRHRRDPRRGALRARRRRLVDSVYSAVCGGHTEDNDAVWGGCQPTRCCAAGPTSSRAPEAFRGASPTEILTAFLSTEAPAYCSVSTFANAKKYRWEKRFTRAEVDAIASPFGVGKRPGDRRRQAR